MWKSFECDNEPYIIKVESKDSSLQVTLSNLRVMWREETSLEKILNRFKEGNPTFECTEEGSKEQIITMINKIEEASSVEIQKNSTSISLTINSKVDRFNVVFKFQMEKLIEDTFFSEITCSLLKTIKCLEESQSTLKDIIKKKDRELEEYRLEKGNITREDLVTEPFDTSSKEKRTNNNFVSLMLDVYNKPTWSKLADVVDKEKCKEKGTETALSNSGRTVKRKVYSAKTSKKRHLT